MIAEVAVPRGSKPAEAERSWRKLASNKLAPKEEPKKPRSLDDLRKLSEVIKAQRARDKGKTSG